MRKQFDDQLAKLRTEMKECGQYCEQSLAQATRVFFDSDIKLLEQVFSITRSIDKKTHKIENLCFMLLLRQQPVAIDLRTITATLKSNFDIKRISSQAFDIAEIVKISEGLKPHEISEDVLQPLRQMAEQAKSMLSQSLSTFFDQDIAGAEQVINSDDLVDDCFAKVKTGIAKSLAGQEQGDYVVDVLMIAKYFERISDHCVNIARWTVKYFG